MKTFLCTGHWMCLLTLTLVMLVTAMQGRTLPHLASQSEAISFQCSEETRSPWWRPKPLHTRFRPERTWQSLCVFLCPATVESSVPIISISCCQNVSSRNLGRIRIRACYEQKPRSDCRRHAFRWSSGLISFFSGWSTLSWIYCSSRASCVPCPQSDHPEEQRVVRQPRSCVAQRQNTEGERESRWRLHGGAPETSGRASEVSAAPEQEGSKQKKLQNTVKISSCSPSSSSNLQGKLLCLPELADSAPRLDANWAQLPVNHLFILLLHLSPIYN